MRLEHIVAANDESEAGRGAAGVGADLATRSGAKLSPLTVVAGIPAIEICRFAEDHQADLVVLGRKPRTRAARLLLGDTADAVARRSLVPSLHVPPGVPQIRRILAALDGTERGTIVFRNASVIAAAIGATLETITVAPSYDPASDRGDVVAEVLDAADATGADVLAVGYRRGGPPGSIEGGSVARRLAHLAPCAFLAVPL